MRSFHLGRTAVAAALAVATTFIPRLAHAQRELLNPMGDRGTLVIDQLSGFRASTVGGIGYATPIGISFQSVSTDHSDDQGRINGTDSIHYTNVWLAPSADYFVIDHLSIGGVIEVVSTSQSLTTTRTAGATTGTTTTSLPTLTSFTFLPRVGWMFGITDRFGIWPRLGLGYASRQTTPDNLTVTDTHSGFVFDIDCGFLYRITESWFLRGAPEITFVPGSHSQTTTIGSTTTTFSTNESTFQFAVVGGIGVMWDLL